MTRLAALRRHAEIAFTIALLAGGEAEVWSGRLDGSKLAMGLFALAWTLPFLLRPWSPALAGILVVAGCAGESFSGDTQAATENSLAFVIAVLAAFWLAGSDPNRPHALAAGVVGVALFVVLIANDPDPLGLSDVSFALVFGAGSWLTGLVLSGRAQDAAELEERAAQLEREREEEARAAVAEERARIARELHDVIAHSVSVMTVQAGAARMLLKEEPERAREPILAVERTGREALAETRRLLGILRRDMAEPELEPQPGMAGLGTLLDHVRLAGLPVELLVEGEGRGRALPAGLDLAAYRIVQEALTNTIKYAGPAQAWVTVRYGADEVELEVSHDGRTPSAGGGGHGLVGMEERVALYGGQLEFGKHPVRGYVVRARLPLEAT